MNNQNNNHAASADDFEEIVSAHYEQLYRFAFSLTRSEADACDLTQQTFYIWATKGRQLRDRKKIKSWLFTTLHRAFLSGRRRAARFPHIELGDAEQDLPAISPEMAGSIDAALAVELLAQVPEPYRVALTLFYLEDYSYQEIADVLELPRGTVQSRIFRGMEQLRQLVANAGECDGSLVPSSLKCRREQEHVLLVKPH